MFLLKITLPFHQSSQKNKNYYNCRQFVVMKHNNKLFSIHSAGVVSTINCLIHKIYFLILPSQIFSSLSVTHYLSPQNLGHQFSKIQPFLFIQKNIFRIGNSLIFNQIQHRGIIFFFIKSAIQ